MTTLTAGALIALLTALATLAAKLIPDRKSVDADKIRRGLASIAASEEIYEKTRDTTDLGSLP